MDLLSRIEDSTDPIKYMLDISQLVIDGGNVSLSFDILFRLPFYLNVFVLGSPLLCHESNVLQTKWCARRLPG